MLTVLQNCAATSKGIADKYDAISKDAESEHQRITNMFEDETKLGAGDTVIRKLSLIVGNAYSKQQKIEFYDFASDGTNLLAFLSQKLDQQIPQDVTNFGLKNPSQWKVEMDKMQKLKMATDAIHKRQASKILAQKRELEEFSLLTNTQSGRNLNKRNSFDRQFSSDAENLKKKPRQNENQDCNGVTEANKALSGTIEELDGKQKEQEISQEGDKASTHEEKDSSSEGSSEYVSSQEGA